MGTPSKQRRTIRERKRQHSWRHHEARSEHHTLSVEELVLSAASYAFGAGADTVVLDRHVERLARLDSGIDSDGGAAAVLHRMLGALWEHGWQPMDVLHVVRREWPQRVGRLALAVIAHEAHTSGALSRAPDEWAGQLRAIGADTSSRLPAVHGWWVAERISAVDGWRDVLRLVGQLAQLPKLQMLGAAPSQWRRTQHVRAAAGTVEPKALAKIRGLLAKAESTDFPEEAEALTAKAQDLMTRYAIDSAVLHAEQGSRVADEVRSRRVHIDKPYPDAKVALLDSVARANTVRVVWLEPLGIASVVGLPTDLDLVELLFTSLLVQATRGMAEVGKDGSGGGRTRSRGFRRAFLLSYAMRIGERLERSSAHANEEASREYGSALVPVLRERAKAVNDVFAEMFPDTVVKESRPVDRQGWFAGRAAADRADLGAARDQLSTR